MFNITQMVTENEIDITVMVLMVLVVAILFCGANLFFEVSKEAEKFKKTLIILGYVFVVIAIFTNLFLIKVSIDCGIEWQKNKMEQSIVIEEENNEN